ncbi:unnamed protein product [Clavelina lepadiformis]|uniref:Uncharacterized protein n=1 Tax=Clavelina lepadiformis TaxID=159417 RepID=A0ABP0FQV9_CLALP
MSGGGKRSPKSSKKQGLAQRPYSMFVGSQYLKAGGGDNLSVTSSSSSSSFADPSSPSRSPTSSLNRSAVKQGKKNSEFYIGNFDSVNCTGRSLDINSNNTDKFYSPPYGDKGKKKGDSSTRVTMQPAGPSARTWTVPKSVKKLNTGGNVFGVHIGKSGTCYVSVVTSKGDRLIQAFDRSGVMIKSFPARATKAGKPFEPYQIHETPEGHLAVASGNCVTVWTKEGKLVIEHGRNMFKFAKCLAVRSTGEIIVTDTDNDAVKVISASGQQIYQLEAKFKCPVGVAVDSNDHVIVADWTDQIKVFDENNELIQTFGKKGGRDGELDLPYGVAVDCEDNIVVADMWNHRLSVYSSDGTFLKHLASESDQSVRMPAHVSVASGTSAEDYRLAVTDFGANSVRLIAY